jgi:hypothetical protein
MLKRKIRIGYEDVKLDLVDNIPSDNGDHVFGEFDSIKNSIVLDKKQTPRSLANCLLHEVIHAVIYQSGQKTLRQRCLKLYGWPSAMADEPFSTVPVAVFPFPVDARALKHAILHQGPAAGVKV